MRYTGRPTTRHAPKGFASAKHPDRWYSRPGWGLILRG